MPDRAPARLAGRPTFHHRSTVRPLRDDGAAHLFFDDASVAAPVGDRGMMACKQSSGWAHTAAGADATWAALHRCEVASETDGKIFTFARSGDLSRRVADGATHGLLQSMWRGLWLGSHRFIEGGRCGANLGDQSSDRAHAAAGVDATRAALIRCANDTRDGRQNFLYSPVRLQSCGAADGAARVLLQSMWRGLWLGSRLLHRARGMQTMQRWSEEREGQAAPLNGDARAAELAVVA